MLLNKHQRRQKEALRLDRERREIWQKKWKADWIKLDKPMQIGYKKFFVLRDDVKSRHDAIEIAEALRLINDTTYSKSPDFKHKCGKVWREHNQPQLRGLPKERYEMLKPQIQAMFSALHNDGFCHQCHKDRTGGYIWGLHYHFRYPWMFDMKIEPHFVTHYQAIDPLLEERLDEIRNKMSYNQYDYTLDHMRGHGQHADWRKDGRLFYDLKRGRIYKHIENEAFEARLGEAYNGGEWDSIYKDEQ